MEIISRSNHGFRKRPTFQKIANKPNKDIDYVVNPLKIVRDSYEFSNLINNDDFVEDEIKNEITNEMFHEQVKKEIERQQTMEQDRINRTVAGLQGPRLPTSLPEMSAQQRVAPQTFDMSTPQAAPPDAAPPPQATEDMNVDSRVRLRARRSIPPPPQETPPLLPSPRLPPIPLAPPLQPPPLPPLEAAPPLETIAQPQDMEVEAVSTKRPSVRIFESKTDRITKAKKGTQIISDLRDIIKQLNKPEIQQQFIMRNINFTRDMTKDQLAMELDKPENKRLADFVEEETVKKRLKEYFDKHGELPIAIYTEQPSKSSSSNEPPSQTPPQASPPTQEVDMGDNVSSSGSDKSINFEQRAPLVIPSKANRQVLYENLTDAYDKGKIVQAKDLAIYHANINVMKYKNKEMKEFVFKNLRDLYKRLVYHPAKHEAKLRIIKPINKYKVIKEEKKNLKKDSGSKR